MSLSERIPEPGGEVHELRVRADGPVSRHTGSGGRAERGQRLHVGQRQEGPARPAQDGHQISGEKGIHTDTMDKT